ncbi:MAG: thioesterase family protein [Bacteroidales bacterium]
MTEVQIPPGIRHEKELIVSADHSALKFGSGMVDVFATPAMIALLESVAMESILSFIPDGYTTVGVEIHIKHLKATPTGRKVKGESYLRKVTGNKLNFEVHAWDEKGLIGIGTHTRVVVEKAAFYEKLK